MMRTHQIKFTYPKNDNKTEDNLNKKWLDKTSNAEKVSTVLDPNGKITEYIKKTSQAVQGQGQGQGKEKS